MFTPADSLLNKHLWALLLSVFSNEMWGTRSQKGLPCYLFFLLSCRPWHPNDTVRCFWPAGIPYQKQARKGEHPVLKSTVIIAEPQKKSTDFLVLVAPMQFKRWPLETPGIIMFIVAQHSIWWHMYWYWPKAKALKSMHRKDNSHQSGQQVVRQPVTLSLPTHVKECYCLETSHHQVDDICWPGRSLTMLCFCAGRQSCCFFLNMVEFVTGQQLQLGTPAVNH